MLRARDIRRRSWFWRALLAVVVAAIALEGGMQLVAFATWLGRPPAPARPAGSLLLCIGDSVTFGLGLEPSAAYPARLQAQLAARGVPWSVANRGIPGNDSADVLTRLPHVLAELRPDAVCVLVGWNDRWSRPAPLPPPTANATATGGDGFVWRWRMPRLLALLAAREDGSDADAHVGELPFVGVWHVGEHGFELWADGTARLGEVAASWRVDGDRLHVQPLGGEPFVVRWAASETGIDFTFPGWDRYRRARRGPPRRVAAVERVEELLESDQFTAATTLVVALPASAEATAARARLCIALVAVDRGAEADALCAELERAYRDEANSDAGEALAVRLAGRGEHAAAAAIARRVLAADRTRPRCWRVVGDAAAGSELAGVVAEVEAVARAQSSRWRQAELALEQAVMLARADVDAAVAAWLAARAGGVGRDASVAAMVHAVARGADGARLRARVEQVAATAPDGGGAMRDMRTATIDETEVYRTLALHVGAIVDCVQASGAQVFVLGYPVPLQRHDDAMRRVAAAQAVPFVPTYSAFVQRSAGSPHGEWFQDPIHCTAKGSELLAAIVAEAIAAELRPRR